ncbi:MAG: GWxTD domain-containing protein [bacterium]|nr:GWxTD domain-containing protein [bacterium]
MKRNVIYLVIVIFLLNDLVHSQDIFKNPDQRQAAFRLILSDEIREIYDLMVADSLKVNWERKFWKMLDPSPDTDFNEFYAEFQKRFSYANRYYSNVIAPLFLDDRGKYHIKFGEPDEKVVSSGVGKAYLDNETWAYYNFNLFIDFVDQLGFGFREVNNLMDAVTSAPSNLKTGIAANLYVEREPLHQKYLSFRDIIDGRAGISPDAKFYQVTKDFASEKRLAFEAAPPSQFDFDYEKEQLDAHIASAIFRGEANQSRAELYYSFPLKQLKFQPGSHSPLETTVEKKLTLFNRNLDKIFQKDETLKLVAREANEVEKRIYLNQHTEQLPAGLYNLALQLESEPSKRLAILRAQLNVRDYSGDSLTMSDIQFSPQIREGVPEQRNLKPNNILVVPYLGNAIRRSNPVYVYFEIYNLKLNDQGKTRFQVAYEVQSIAANATSPVASAIQFITHLIGNKSERQVGASFESEGSAEFQQIYLMIDFSKFSTGHCSLNISITDLENGARVSGQKRMVLK